MKVPRLVDDTHAAAAQFTNDLVGPDAGTGSQLRGRFVHRALPEGDRLLRKRG